MSGSLFYTGLSGLSVARSSLMTTAHNTANVYTTGYTRQVAEVATNGAINSGSGYIGSGARITTVSRSYDRYLTAQLATAQSTSAALSAYGSQINRIDTLLADKTSGLSPLMQNFFTAVQGVANTPADSAARQQLISSAQALANKFRSTDQYLTDQNNSINEQIVGSVDQINTYASKIASLNQQISMMTAVAGGQPPNDLLDQRDQLVSDLSQIVDVKVLEQDNGKYNVFIATGQSLVVGDQAAKMQAVQSSADPMRKAIALVGIAGNVQELKDGAITGGSLGGILSFRSETLTPAQNAIGRLAAALASAVNDQHNLGVDLNGVLGKDFFATGAPAVFSNLKNVGSLVMSASITNASQLTTSDYSVQTKMVAGAATYVVTRLSDNQVIPVSTTTDGGTPPTVLALDFEGVRVSMGSGTPANGDTFLVQPTRFAARDMDVLVTDPAKVAAASPVITGTTAGNQGNAAISTATIGAPYQYVPLASNLTLSYDAATGDLNGFPAGSYITVTPASGPSVTYNPGDAIPYSAGATYSFDGITFTMTGTPADGDSFTVNKNNGGVSDGSNALLLGALQRKALVGGGTTTFNGAYSQLVSEVGNKAMEISVASKTQDSVTGQIKAAQQSISGVNQDEETANLLMFQQMYQANAKVIQTASTIFDAILAISA